jgi:hypothetical protein
MLSSFSSFLGMVTPKELPILITFCDIGYIPFSCLL